MKARLIAVAVLALVGGGALLLGRTERAADEHLLVSTLYDRIDTKMKQNPELAKAIGSPSPELRDAAWLVGRWNVTSRVFAHGVEPEMTEHGQSTVEEILDGTWLQIRDTYDGQVHDLGFLTFNAATKEWISTGVDKYGNTVTARAKGWKGNRLPLVAEDAQILGERVVLRQTLEKRSDHEYRILNEERLPSGDWAVIDEYVYRKQ